MPTPDISDISPIERKIGSTIYIVTADYALTATETPHAKIRRLLVQDLKSVS